MKFLYIRMKPGIILPESAVRYRCIPQRSSKRCGKCGAK